MRKLTIILIFSLILISSGFQLDLPKESRTDYEITGIQTHGYTDPGYVLKRYLKYEIEIDSSYTMQDIRNLSHNLSLKKAEETTEEILQLLYTIIGKSYIFVEIEDPSKPYDCMKIRKL